GVHGGDEHEVGGVGDGALGARDGDYFVFEGLAQDFEDVLAEFGQFVEEEDAPVGEADFAGARHAASADKTRVADGVVRGAKRALQDEWHVRGEHAADAVYLGDVKRFLDDHAR